MIECVAGIISGWEIPTTDFIKLITGCQCSSDIFPIWVAVFSRLLAICRHSSTRQHEEGKAVEEDGLGHNQSRNRWASKALFETTTRNDQLQYRKK